VRYLDRTRYGDVGVDPGLQIPGSALLKPAANDVLVRWPVSKRVNSSRADDEAGTLIDRIELAVVD
jgi:hypothetical protein